MKTTTGNLHSLLDRLRRTKIHYRLRDGREGALSIDITVPGERWEVDLLADGTTDIEIFRSDGTIHGETKLEELLARFSD